ncbi:hypothetical protein F9B85_10555 [Heliorestis acidaminivorans]|uniref:Prepilin type IV endopeptidase peptidase domain-containing protein n=1 Tax=Heliorestis acidaminivorans TaxID=553427 RepID=A0A6I0EVN8_9FIRM|nr:A24 family peptidase [Heliorestis acidaminivorans]KAB2951988.1 hypothetical protein F9B85_10555 [Heliorestis acidaminivorans]
MIFTIKSVLLFLGLFIAALIDKKTFTIPNWLTITMIVVGLFFGFLPEGSFSVEAGLIRFFETILIFGMVLLPFLFKVPWLLPGGDGKLFIAITAFNGITLSVYAVLAGLILAIMEALLINWRRNLSFKEFRQLQIPLAPSILLGTIVIFIYTVY